MSTVTTDEAMQKLPELLQEVKQEAVAIESDGRQVAYLVSPEQYATTREAKTKRLLESMSALQDEIQRNVQEKGLDVNELLRDLDPKQT